MLKVSAAIAKLVAEAQPIVQRRRYCIEKIPIEQSLGRLLAADLIADMDVPPAANSAMDGYAFCRNDAIQCNFINLDKKSFHKNSGTYDTVFNSYNNIFIFIPFHSTK